MKVGAFFWGNDPVLAQAWRYQEKHIGSRLAGVLKKRAKEATANLAKEHMCCLVEMMFPGQSPVLPEFAGTMHACPTEEIFEKTFWVGLLREQFHTLGFKHVKCIGSTRSKRVIFRHWIVSKDEECHLSEPFVLPVSYMFGHEIVYKSKTYNIVSSHIPLAVDDLAEEGVCLQFTRNRDLALRALLQQKLERFTWVHTDYSPEEPQAASLLEILRSHNRPELRNGLLRIDSAASWGPTVQELSRFAVRPHYPTLSHIKHTKHPSAMYWTLVSDLAPYPGRPHLIAEEVTK